MEKLIKCNCKENIFKKIDFKFDKEVRTCFV